MGVGQTTSVAPQSCVTAVAAAARWQAPHTNSPGGARFRPTLAACIQASQASHCSQRPAMVGSARVEGRVVQGLRAGCVRGRVHPGVEGVALQPETCRIREGVGAGCVRGRVHPGVAGVALRLVPGGEWMGGQGAGWVGGVEPASGGGVLCLCRCNMKSTSQQW